MDIKEFFELSAGKWFSQRTSYYFASGQQDNSNSEITIEILFPDNPEVITLCQHYNFEPTATWGGVKFSWDSSTDWGKTKHQGYTIAIPIPDADNPQAGKLLRKMSNRSSQTPPGHYLIGKDESLSIVVDEGNLYAEERLWFASPNLRMRTSLIKGASGFNLASFYSAIRKIPPKPQE